ncbi:MAG: diaminopimelate decarboxylase [Anaerovoracaceae bacterium]
MEEKNKLYFDGCDVTELAKEYGTPLYVMSETAIVGKFSQLKEEFLDKYENTRVAYAAKAFFPMAMAKIAEREGMCVDVVSGGELYTALKAGFPPERIEFNGNNKLPDELRLAVKNGIGRIIVDGFSELERIEEICKEENRRISVLFRVTPGIKADSHDYIVTGKKDSKFGFPLDDEVLQDQISRAIQSEYIDFKGLHFHIGSQLFDNGPYLQALDIILELTKKIREKFGVDVSEINFGGGFGIQYIDEERKSYSYFLDPMMEKMEKFCREEGMERPAVVIEPGRSIVGEAGISVYTIGQIKDIKGVRKYVSVDGGMTDNIRPALYQSLYTGVIANKADEEKTEIVTICGKCCESGDILIRDLKVPAPEQGDIFAIFSTGAYGYSMASNYNRNCIPPVVLVKEGKSRLIVKGQDYEDLLRNDIIPEDL